MAQKLLQYQQTPASGATMPHAVGAPTLDNGGINTLKTALDAGINGLGIVARDWKRYQTSRMEEAVAGVERQFEEWKSEYTRTNQGRDAAMAQRDFTQKYDELSNQALKDYDAPEYTIFRDQIKKKLAARGLMAFKDGGRYQKSQTEAWEKSVWDGSLATFAQEITAHADDPDRLQLMAKERLELWRGQNPGLDDTAIKTKLNQMVVQGQLDTFISQQRWDEAEAVLGVPVAQPQGTVPRKSSGTIAEDLHNPGNLKLPGHNGGARSDYQNFATDEDGWRGMAAQLARYQTKHGLKTARQMVQRWAPASDGNNHKNYFATMQKHGLENLDAPIDVNDKHQLAILCKAMSMAESPLGARYSVDQIEKALRENGGKARTQAPWGSGRNALPPSGGNSGPGIIRVAYDPDSGGILDVATAAHYRGQIAAGRQRQYEAQEVAFETRHKDYLAQCLDGIVPARAPEPADFAGFGKKAADKYLEAAAHYEYGVNVNMLRKVSPALHEYLLKNMEPQPGSGGYADRRKMHEKLQSESEKMKKALEKDPVRWLITHDPAVQAAREKLFSDPKGELTRENFTAYYQAALTAQKMRGVQNPRIFSAEDAAHLGDLYAAQRDPTPYTYGFQQAFGSLHGQAMQEIMPHMPQAAVFAASGMNPNAAKLLFDMHSELKKNKKFVTDLYDNSSDKITKKDFQKNVIEAVQPAMNSFLGGVHDRYATAVREETELLALAYTRRGLEPGQAVKRAAQDVILDRYTFAANPNAADLTVRIPRNLNSDHIAKGMRNYLYRADLADMSLQHLPFVNEEKERRAFQDMIRNQGYFVTNSDETGVYLYVGSKLIEDKSGKPLNIPWEQLAKLGNQVEPNDEDFTWD